MPPTHQSRIFESGDVTTPNATIPTQTVADFRFPFRADVAVPVAIDNDRLIITPTRGDAR